MAVSSTFQETPTIKEFLELSKKALEQLLYCSKNEFKYHKEIEFLSTQLSSNITYVFESILIRLKKDNKEKLNTFINKLEKINNVNTEYYSDLYKFYIECFSIIEEYGKNEDLLILTPKGA